MNKDLGVKVNTLSAQCFADGSGKVTVWCECQTQDSIADVIAWLELAASMLNAWDNIRNGEEE